MVPRRYTQVRAFILLVAMSLGLFTQVVTAVALPMRQDNVLAARMSMPGSGHCSDCGMRSHAMTMAPSCTAAPCLATPAILSRGLFIEPVSGSEFALSTYEMRQGVTVCPTLAPPKPIHHS
jgi:hypothetical protein